MSDEKSAEPGFALVRNKQTDNVYVTKWRDEDTEVLQELDTDAYGQPVPLAPDELEKLTAKKKVASVTTKEQS